jgi:hypothetical protein
MIQQSHEEFSRAAKIAETEVRGRRRILRVEKEQNVADGRKGRACGVTLPQLQFGDPSPELAACLSSLALFSESRGEAVVSEGLLRTATKMAADAPPTVGGGEGISPVNVAIFSFKSLCLSLSVSSSLPPSLSLFRCLFMSLCRAVISIDSLCLCFFLSLFFVSVLRLEAAPCSELLSF